MEKLLITGGSGFLGSRAAEFFRDRYDVYAPTHKEMDITDENQVISRLLDWKPDIVLHCAAVSDIDQCQREPERSREINVTGSVNLAKASEMTGAKCLICSSDQVYVGSELEGPHREQEALMPENLYGREKLKAEEKCLEINPGCVHLRLSWMYDPVNVCSAKQGDFFRTLTDGIRNAQKLHYPIYDVRGLSDVNEVIRNLEPAFGLEGGVYNFGSPNEKSTYDTVHRVFERLGQDTGLLVKNQQAYASKPRNISMSQEKLNCKGIFFASTEERLFDSLRLHGRI